MTKDFLWRLKLHVGNWNEWPIAAVQSHACYLVSHLIPRLRVKPVKCPSVSPCGVNMFRTLRLRYRSAWADVNETCHAYSVYRSGDMTSTKRNLKFRPLRHAGEMTGPNWGAFCRGTLRISAANAIARCPSVRPSVRHFMYSVETSFLAIAFLTPNIMAKFCRRSPSGGVECKRGRQKPRFSTNIWLSDQ